MQENLERVKSCGLKQLARRRRFESETREKGNKQLHWWDELSLSRCPRNTNMWQPRRREWDRQWLWHSEMGNNSIGIAALWLLAGASLHALTAVACAHTSAEWMKSRLSHSSEAGTDPRKEGGWERRSGLAKNMSRNPQGPTGEQC